MNDGDAREPNPTHWRQFDRLYDLATPGPYFRGVHGGAYRMPRVVAAMLERLIPVVAPRRSGDAVRLLDFACGYGAVGLCLRFGLTMEELYRHYATDREIAEDIAVLSPLRRTDLPAHRIDGIDIAARALDYARAVGAIDASHAVDVMAAAPNPAAPNPAAPDPAAAEAVARTDLIFECGALGDHIAPAADALLTLAGAARPAMIFCPRPRVDVDRLERVLNSHGYRLETLIPGVRYRKPFSPEEGAEEIAAGAHYGLPPEACLIDGYFRVDIRIALPEDQDGGPFHAAVVGFDANADP